MKRLMIVFFFLLWSCNPTPEPPPTTTTTSEPSTTTTTVPVRGTPFQWYLARGFSLFSGASADPYWIRELYHTVQGQWPHLYATARVCAERERWPENHPYLYKGPSAEPYDQTAPAFIETKRFLDTAASIQYAQVLLVPVCTLKEDWSDADIRSGKAFNVNEQWVRTICKLASSYDNVAIEVINEWRHPSSIYTKPDGLRQDQVNRMIRACRDEAPELQIGTDSNVNKNRMTYDEKIAPNVDFFSYHPWRNPDPDEDEMRAMVRQRIGGTVFSETTCYEEGAEARGNCTGSKDQILQYMSDAERKGAVFFYHTKYLGLCWPRSDCQQFGWIPPRGDHEIRHGR